MHLWNKHVHFCWAFKIKLNVKYPPNSSFQWAMQFVLEECAHVSFFFSIFIFHCVNKLCSPEECLELWLLSIEARSPFLEKVLSFLNSINYNQVHFGSTYSWSDREKISMVPVHLHICEALVLVGIVSMGCACMHSALLFTQSIYVRLAE